MVSEITTLKNANGLHLRVAGKLAKAACNYDGCEILIHSNGKHADAKSVMQLMMSCIKCGNQVEITCNGTNEQTAASEILNMFEKQFDEPN
jgi:phosphocarrier protein